ncbi:TonB-dependent receptor [Sunxiuqinia sp. A32]|uniref:TonB-dependent receptor n=1 Tax=Sunxiuqinia sp. A32 TaxID=3461496 RepID=UPI004046302B
MKKKWFNDWRVTSPIQKWLRIMKLTLLIFLATFMHLSASVYSQQTKLDLTLQNATIREALRSIEDQSGYYFLYTNEDVEINRKVNIDLKKMSIEDVLDNLFKGTDVVYKIADRQVVLLKENQTNANVNQQTSVSGKVTDVSGAPLPGVTVIIKGTTQGTITDFEGNYTISNVPGDATLIISFVGMRTQEILVGGRSNINVKLEEETVGIEEVVAVGYGTLTKRELTAAVSSVKSEDLVDRTNAFNVMESLAGKVAGVKNISFSGKPGGASSLRIRGMGSINADSNPIYVLDGVVGVDPQIINASNIESIDVLKDAAATAMYGAQGSNGVVIITTKSGKKDQGTLTYSGKLGVGYLGRKIDVLDADGFMEVQKRAYGYSGKVMPHLINPMENLFYYSKDASGNFLRDDAGNLIASPKYDTDWQDAITQNAITEDHNLAFSTRNDKTAVYASLGYQDFRGLVKYTYSERFSGTVNLQSEINDWLNIQAVVTTGSRKSNDMEGGFGQGPIRNMIEMPPIVPVQYEDGTWGRKSDYPLGESGESPIRLLQNQKNIQERNFTVFNLVSTFKLHDNLYFTAKGDMQTTNGRNIRYAKAGLLDVSETNNGFADIYNSVSRKMSNEDYFTYSNSFFDDQIKSNFVLGASWYYYRSESSSSGSEDYFDDYFQYYNLGAGTTYHAPSSGMTQNTISSFYFRMNHSFKDRYYLGITLRADGASNFGANNKYGYFPSASAAWVISDEDFFGSAKNVFNNMKLRLSYGAVGNASIPNYRTISSYSNNSLIFNKVLQPYVILGNLGNADLKWETSKQFNLGLDMGLYDNRFELLVDLYHKSTQDLLFSKQVPYTTGYASTWTNLGEIVNEGLEVTLTSRNIATRNFNWTTNLIFSNNKLVVKDVGGETINTGNNTVAKEGEEWATYYVYKRIGTWGLDEIEEAAVFGKKPGDLKYEDVDGDGVINDNDRQPFGNGLPKGDFNMVNTLSYKGLSLMVDLNLSYGAKLMGITTTMMENRQIYGNSMVSVLDAWTPENQNSMISAIRLPSDVYFGENEKDSRMLYNGDFLRIRNIALTYDFNSKTLNKIGFIKGLSVGVNIENAYVFTSFPGFDPEIGAFSTDSGQGIEFYSYPRPTTVSANLNVTF